MSGSKLSQQSDLLWRVLDYVKGSAGLSFEQLGEAGLFSVNQSLDGKTFRFNSTDLQEVITRTDAEGKDFVQVNFNSGVKVLITDTLVGFKPQQVHGLDMNKIPKVVTTPDLISVFDALEESMCDHSQVDYEVEVLKKVFQAILFGGENAGFDLSFERKWLSRLLSSKLRASA